MKGLIIIVFSVVINIIWATRFVGYRRLDQLNRDMFERKHELEVKRTHVSRKLEHEMYCPPISPNENHHDRILIKHKRDNECDMTEKELMNIELSLRMVDDFQNPKRVEAKRIENWLNANIFIQYLTIVDIWASFY